MVDFFHMNERFLGKKFKKQSKENLAILKGLLEEKVTSLETTPLAS